MCDRLPKAFHFCSVFTQSRLIDVLEVDTIILKFLPLLLIFCPVFNTYLGLLYNFPSCDYKVFIFILSSRRLVSGNAPKVDMLFSPTIQLLLLSTVCKESLRLKFI